MRMEGEADDGAGGSATLAISRDRVMRVFDAVEAAELDADELCVAIRRVPPLRGALVQRLQRELADAAGAPPESLAAALVVALDGCDVAQAQRYASRLLGKGEETVTNRLDDALRAFRMPSPTCMALLGAILTLRDVESRDPTRLGAEAIGSPRHELAKHPMVMEGSQAVESCHDAPDGELIDMPDSRGVESRLALVCRLTAIVSEDLRATTSTDRAMLIDCWEYSGRTPLPPWLTSGSPAATTARAKLTSLVGALRLTATALARATPLGLVEWPPSSLQVQHSGDVDVSISIDRGALTATNIDDTFNAQLSDSIIPAAVACIIAARSSHLSQTTGVKGGRASRLRNASVPMSLEALIGYLASDLTVCPRCAAAALLDMVAAQRIATTASWMLHASRLSALSSLHPSVRFGRLAMSLSEYFLPAHRECAKQLNDPEIMVCNPGARNFLHGQHSGASVALQAPSWGDRRLKKLVVWAALLHAEEGAWHASDDKQMAADFISLLAADPFCHAQEATGQGEVAPFISRIARTWSRIWGKRRSTASICAETTAPDGSGHAFLELDELIDCGYGGALAVRTAMHAVRCTGGDMPLSRLLASLEAEAARGTEAVLIACERLLKILLSLPLHLDAARASGETREALLQAEQDARGLCNVLPRDRLTAAMASALFSILACPATYGKCRAHAEPCTFLESLPHLNDALGVVDSILPPGMELEILNVALTSAMLESPRDSMADPTSNDYVDTRRGGSIGIVLDAASWLATRLDSPFQYMQWFSCCLERTIRSHSISMRQPHDARLRLLHSAAERVRSGWEAPHVVLQQCAAATTASSSQGRSADVSMRALATSLVQAALRAGIRPRRSMHAILDDCHGDTIPPSFKPPDAEVFEREEEAKRLEWLLSLQACGDLALRSCLQTLLSSESGVERWDHFVRQSLHREMRLLLATVDGARARLHAWRRLALLLSRLSRWRLPARDVIRTFIAPPVCLGNNSDDGVRLSPLQMENVIETYLEQGVTRMEGSGEPACSRGKVPSLSRDEDRMVLPNVAVLAVNLVRMVAQGTSSEERRAGADAVLRFHEWLPTATLVQEVRKIVVQDQSHIEAGGHRGRRSGSESVRALQLLTRLPPRPADCSTIDWAAIFDETLVLRLVLPGENEFPTSFERKETVNALALPLAPSVLDWAFSSLASIEPCPWLRWRLGWLLQRPTSSQAALTAQLRWKQSWDASGVVWANADVRDDSVDCSPCTPCPSTSETFDEDVKGSPAVVCASVVPQNQHDPNKFSCAFAPLPTCVWWELCAWHDANLVHELDDSLLSVLTAHHLPSNASSLERARLAERIFFLTTERLLSDPEVASPMVAIRLMRICAQLVPEAVYASYSTAPIIGNPEVAGEGVRGTSLHPACWLHRALKSSADRFLDTSRRAESSKSTHSGPYRSRGSINGNDFEAAQVAIVLASCVRALPSQLLALRPTRVMALHGGEEAGKLMMSVLRCCIALGPPLLTELLLNTAQQLTVLPAFVLEGGSCRSPTAHADMWLSRMCTDLMDELDPSQCAALETMLNVCESDFIKPRIARTPWLGATTSRLIQNLRTVCVGDPPCSLRSVTAKKRLNLHSSPVYVSGTPAISPRQVTLSSKWPKRKGDFPHVHAERQAKAARLAKVDVHGQDDPSQLGS